MCELISNFTTIMNTDDNLMLKYNKYLENPITNSQNTHFMKKI